MTRFRCDGIFNDSFIANFQEIVKVKKIENRSVFNEVVPKILLVSFFRTRCILNTKRSVYVINNGACTPKVASKVGPRRRKTEN